VAERILTLGGHPSHTFAAYLEKSEISVGENIKDDEPAVQLVLNDLLKLIEMERPLIDKAGELGDEGTADMLTGFMGEQEKTAWMFRSWLG
jgi:starvation-inducible DNA-binding protein